MWVLVPPYYMAPEQMTGRVIDHRVDIYSLGIVLYELITGRKPYQADTPLAVMIQHIQDPLPRPVEFIQGIPNEVEANII